MPTFGLANARAEASRRNGAKSRGPKTREGKARAAQNALKHGLCAQKHVVLREEDAAELAAPEAELATRSTGVWRARVPAAPSGGRTDSHDRMDRQTT